MGSAKHVAYEPHSGFGFGPCIESRLPEHDPRIKIAARALRIDETDRLPLKLREIFDPRVLTNNDGRVVKLRGSVHFLEQCLGARFPFRRQKS